MCFSAAASFTLGSLLIPLGIAGVIGAYKNNKNYLLIAITPIIFGLQQYLEGIIWHLLHRGNSYSAQAYAYIYLFFVCFFWPAYAPLCAYLIEKNAVRRKILWAFSIAGLILGAMIYTPILLRVVPLTVSIVNNSIYYEHYKPTLLFNITALLYCAMLIVPLLLSSVKRLRIFGVIALLSWSIAYWWYIYAFTSVWCFFAAAISVYLVFIIYKLPDDKYS